VANTILTAKEKLGKKIPDCMDLHSSNGAKHINKYLPLFDKYDERRMIGYFYHDIHHWSWEGCVG
jgi:hypothetical protein